jgi:hypothetical protein
MSDPCGGRFTVRMGHMLGTAAGKRVGELVIGSRFNGPPSTANGGYACGAVAGYVDGPAKVVLRHPPPLDTTLDAWADPDGHIRVLRGETLIAEAFRAEGPRLEPPARPTLEEAMAARQRNPWRGVEHLLSDCFVCGVNRPDSLGVTPGPVPGADELLAAPFLPDASVATNGIVDRAVVWAVLDCPSFPAEALHAGWIGLLGTLEVRLDRDVEVGERLIVVGWTRAREGRKYLTASALLAEDGSTVARALAIWVGLGQQVTQGRSDVR